MLLRSKPARRTSNNHVIASVHGELRVSADSRPYDKEYPATCLGVVLRSRLYLWLLRAIHSLVDETVGRGYSCVATCQRCSKRVLCCFGHLSSACS